VVTADHETGGLALGNQKNHYKTHFSYLENQKVSYEKFNDIITKFRKSLTGNFDQDNKAFFDLLEKYFGLGNEIAMTEEERSTIWFAFEKSQEKPGVKKHYNDDFLPITKSIMQTMSEKAGVGWTTYAHTGVEIPIYAIGPGSELFSGTIDNTDIPKIMEKQLGFEETEKP
jgi:alkaline phosphatase